LLGLGPRQLLAWLIILFFCGYKTLTNGAYVCGYNSGDNWQGVTGALTGAITPHDSSMNCHWACTAWVGTSSKNLSETGPTVYYDTLTGTCPGTGTGTGGA
jgi:hypothetical protein